MQIQMDNIVFVKWSGMAVTRHAFDSGLKFWLSKRCFFSLLFQVFFPIISSVLLDLCKARVQGWMRTSFSLVAWKTHHLSTSIKTVSWINSYWPFTSESDSSLAKTRSMQSMHDWHCVRYGCWQSFDWLLCFPPYRCTLIHPSLIKNNVQLKLLLVFQKKKVSSHVKGRVSRGCPKHRKKLLLMWYIICLSHGL